VSATAEEWTDSDAWKLTPSKASGSLGQARRSGDRRAIADDATPKHQRSPKGSIVDAVEPPDP
jgi:hypothetical protein